ncbi:hypothetical protein [Phascolarctobacterium faecium]|uniref:hypothetical protein n=1 Tax=Phascolarctobacterium faecium TaxID=33025 RepID=UPI003FED57DB
MQIQKVQIISNLICYGPCPEYDEEVEQSLTISRTGRVWFTGYNFGQGFDEHVMGRGKQLSIAKEAAQRILQYISIYYESKNFTPYVTDVGSWQLKLTTIDGQKVGVVGSLTGDVVVENVDLTDYIRQSINIASLVVFGGGIGEHKYN